MSSYTTKKCLICNKGSKNDTLYWHISADNGLIWCWCNKCNRAYDVYTYSALAGLELKEFLKQDFNFIDAKPMEVRKCEWPAWYLSLSDPRSEEGKRYVESRGLEIAGDIYYDLPSNGIVFPYYYENHFVGAQVRFINPIVLDSGETQKMSTLPGTRLGLLFYNWNQGRFITDIKGIIAFEGAFNALSVEQSLNHMYGGVSKNPWKCVACSGSGATKHHTETLKELKDQGFKIIIAPDSDEAGIKMLKKFSDADAVTHYAFTGDDKADWNDVYKAIGKQEFAPWFFDKVKKL